MSTSQILSFLPSSPNPTEAGTPTMEDLQTQHRKEQRDLQAKITQKKKNATKKTRKGVDDECETLERELKERQRVELDGFEITRNGEAVANDIGDLSLDVDANEAAEENDTAALTDPPARLPSHTPSSTPSTTTAPKKRNRQKDRLARRAAEQDAAFLAAESEAANMPNQRELELNSMAKHREKLNLEEIPIRPDGHCLYSAIATSLPDETVKESGPYATGYQNVRHLAASFIASHPDDFSAFLEEPVGSYTRKIRETAEWGGAVELQALSRALGRKINVLQNDGRVEGIGGEEAKDREEIWLAYYRHSFGLGEHYNALKRKV